MMNIRDVHSEHHQQCKYHPESGNHESPEHPPAKWWQLSYWIMGIGSLIWLAIRSGTKPRRLTYPCQRIAAANSFGFLAYLAALLGSATFLRRLKRAFTPARLVVFVLGLMLTVALQSSVTDPATPILAASPDLPDWTSAVAVSDVFAVTDVPEPSYSLDGGDIPGGVSPDEALHDDGVDALIGLIESKGDYFYRTTGHPDGLFGSDDVIVIKVNNQWDGRNGTNSDVVKGVIYWLVNHPDGFDGAVIIAENTQRHNSDWYQEPSGNNSQFQDQSYQEVAQAFAGEGYHVCISDWRGIREDFVDDYDDGDNGDGYVMLDADSSSEEQGHERLSYPKFQVNCNGMSLRVSMRNGIWNGSSWDNDRLKMINMPVLKEHDAAGATIAVKNYLGFITTGGSNRWISPGYLHCWLLSTATADGGTCTSYTQGYGLIGRQMARIRRADLDILDAIWVNPCSNTNQHASAKRQDVLMASRDPFALDYYASEYVLGPLIQQYGGECYNDPDHEEARASTHGGLFRSLLMHNEDRLRTEGVSDTIDMDDGMTRNEELAQFNVYVADATEPLVPTLNLLAPDGGERWTIGQQEQIRWSSTGAVGNVRIEYSTDGFGTQHVIASSTANDGTYNWTIPLDPSDAVLVRVSSTISATISDTSQAAFTIAGPHDFEDSFKEVSQSNLEGGERITYAIVLYEGIDAQFTLADDIPWPYTYVPGSADIEPAWKGPVQDADGIQWSGTVTAMVPVTITFQAQVPVTTTMLTVFNRAYVSRNGAAPVELAALSIVNGFHTYLPITFRNY